MTLDDGVPAAEASACDGVDHSSVSGGSDPVLAYGCSLSIGFIFE